MQTLGISLFSSLIDGMSSSMSYEMIDLCLFLVIGKSIYLKQLHFWIEGYLSQK